MHHINAFIDTSGAARKRDKAEPGPGYTSFSGPGIDDLRGAGLLGRRARAAATSPRGSAIRLPRQSDVILQIHYHPTGKPEVDRTRIGRLLLARAGQAGAPLEHRVELGFPAPARATSNIEVKASWYVPVDVEALAVSPTCTCSGATCG